MLWGIYYKLLSIHWSLYLSNLIISLHYFFVCAILCVHAYTHTHIHTFTHTHIYIYIYTHTHIHTYTHIQIHIYTHKHIHTYTHTHTHIHTHTHTLSSPIQCPSLLASNTTDCNSPPVLRSPVLAVLRSSQQFTVCSPSYPLIQNYNIKWNTRLGQSR